MRLRILPIAALSCALFAQQPTGEKLAPYYPTPETIVERMLALGELKAGEKMFDLGSGDGRIVIMAAQKYHADATGVELDSDLAQSSAAEDSPAGAAKDRAHHLRRHPEAELLLRQSDYRLPLPESNIKVRPVLDATLKKGTRIVAHDFEIGGWTPVKTVTIPDDGEGRSHTLFLYIH